MKEKKLYSAYDPRHGDVTTEWVALVKLAQENKARTEADKIARR